MSIANTNISVNGYHQAVINWTHKPQTKVWISDEVEDLSLPTFISSEADSTGVSIEQDLIDVDEAMSDERWLTDGLPDTDYQPAGAAAEYGLGMGEY